MQKGDFKGSAKNKSRSQILPILLCKRRAPTLIAWQNLLNALVIAKPRLFRDGAILKTMNWRLHKKNRSWLTALMMCLLVFTSQFALASYICPQENGAQKMSMPCHSSDESQSPLCAKHCHPEDQTSDAHVPVFIALLPPALSWRLPESTPTPLRLAELSSCPATGPPFTIQFCRFRE